jgi:hypothetical protein
MHSDYRVFIQETLQVQLEGLSGQQMDRNRTTVECIDDEHVVILQLPVRRFTLQRDPSVSFHDLNPSPTIRQE